MTYDNSITNNWQLKEQYLVVRPPPRITYIYTGGGAVIADDPHNREKISPLRTRCIKDPAT